MEVYFDDYAAPVFYDVGDSARGHHLAAGADDQTDFCLLRQLCRSRVHFCGDTFTEKNEVRFEQSAACGAGWWNPFEWNVGCVEKGPAGHAL